MTPPAGGMLIESKDYVKARYGDSSRMLFSGQELNGTTWSLCKMNMLFHDLYDAEILQGDTVADPQHIDKGELKTYDMVIANPPFSANYSDIKNFRDRFHFWMPKKKKADFMFVQHMISVLNNTGRMAVVMPHGVLFRGSEEKSMRKWLVNNKNRCILEAVIGLPQSLFYGTGIPASVLVINKLDAATRNEVLFINADREYKEGKNQNKLRPEDIAKIAYVYRKKEELKGYSKLVKTEELEKEKYNFNIRRYVDNSPPAEPQDVHAHLHGGIPIAEVEALNGFWTNYPELKDTIFAPLKEGYMKFTEQVKTKDEIKELVNNHSDLEKKRSAYTKAVNEWWKNHVNLLEALPKNQNVFVLHRSFAKSIATDFNALGILDLYKSRGAFEAYWSTLESDLKSVSASGWNAELIPEDEILQSQFPEVLEELAANEARRDELEVLFTEVNELEEGEYDEENYEVFPKDVLKEYKSNLKATKSEANKLKKEIRALKARIKADPENQSLYMQLSDKEEYEIDVRTRMTGEENKLARHTELEQELKECKAAIKEIKDKKDDLVEKAREKITPEEAKELILARWKQTLQNTVMDYVNRYERDFLAELEKRFVKYQETLTSVLNERDEAATQLSNFLNELGYEG